MFPAGTATPTGAEILFGSLHRPENTRGYQKPRVQTRTPRKIGDRCLYTQRLKKNDQTGFFVTFDLAKLEFLLTCQVLINTFLGRVVGQSSVLCD